MEAKLTILKDTISSNLHLVEVYEPHYWSMRLLDFLIGEEKMDLGDIKARRAPMPIGCRPVARTREEQIARTLRSFPDAILAIHA